MSGSRFMASILRSGWELHVARTKGYIASFSIRIFLEAIFLYCVFRVRPRNFVLRLCFRTADSSVYLAMVPDYSHKPIPANRQGVD